MEVIRCPHGFNKLHTLLQVHYIFKYSTAHIQVYKKREYQFMPRGILHLTHVLGSCDTKEYCLRVITDRLKMLASNFCHALFTRE